MTRNTTRHTRWVTILLSLLAGIGLIVVTLIALPWAARRGADERPGDASDQYRESPPPSGPPRSSALPVAPIISGLSPPEVPADCSRDATAELNAWIAEVPDGSTLTFTRSGCYRTESPIQVEHKKDLVFEGNGATFRRTELTPHSMRYPQHSPHWLVVNSNNLTFRNLRVEGTNTGLTTLSRLRGLLPGGRSATDSKGREQHISCEEDEEGYGCYSKTFAFEHGWHFGEVDDVTLEHAVVEAVWGDGIYVGRNLTDPDGSTNVRITDVTIDRNGRQGVAIGKASNVLIDGARVLHSHRAAVDLEPTSASGSAIEGVEIRNSEFRSRLRALAAHGRGGVNDVYYHHNRILESAGPLVDAESTIGTTRFRWRIHDNVYAGVVSRPAFRFVGTKEIDIRGNVVQYAGDGAQQAVHLSEGSEAFIACNWFQAAVDLVQSDATSRWKDEDNSLTATPPTCLPHPAVNRTGWRY
ncbi:MAG: right-handed parallel beta-helix repeat-containing protein [Actinomycetota bacterium]|nr:right-handed parallel beta-helix repeat-containing protein [Actinomycetota bacterium]